ncbi:hypothetical protein C8R43DRAFT_1133177 [Mycena crocata]|nr:hypothetical protein C8R43DRAFT_1133177 [Mycena crocata]
MSTEPNSTKNDGLERKFITGTQDGSNGPRGEEEVEKRQKMIDDYRKELSSEDGATEKRNADSEVEV